jgi:hypothetical protein
LVRDTDESEGDYLAELMGLINEADAKCRGFSATILEDSFEAVLEEHEEEDEEREVINGILNRGKRKVRDLDDEEDLCRNDNSVHEEERPCSHVIPSRVKRLKT